jgi:hypothetical protein
LATADIQEILPMMALLRLPGQPPIGEGLFNYRGTLIPVVLLRHLFSAPAVPLELYTPFIVVVPAGTRRFRRERLRRWRLRRRRESFSAAARGAFADEEELQRLHELSAEGVRRLAEIEASRS